MDNLHEQFTKYHFIKLTSGRHPCEWKQHLIKEGHIVYLATTLATKHFEQIQYSIKN